MAPVSSGHLWYVDDETEAEPAAVITPYRDGPLLVRGAFRLVDQNGVEIDGGRRTVALCRCGRSASKPFCDGSHKAVRFSAPSGREPSAAALPAYLPGRMGRDAQPDLAVLDPAVADPLPQREPGADAALEHPQRRAQRSGHGKDVPTAGSATAELGNG